MRPLSLVTIRSKPHFAGRFRSEEPLRGLPINTLGASPPVEQTLQLLGSRLLGSARPSESEWDQFILDGLEALSQRIAEGRFQVKNPISHSSQANRPGDWRVYYTRRSTCDLEIEGLSIPLRLEYDQCGHYGDKTKDVIHAIRLLRHSPYKYTEHSRIFNIYYCGPENPTGRKGLLGYFAKKPAGFSEFSFFPDNGRIDKRFKPSNKPEIHQRIRELLFQIVNHPEVSKYIPNYD